MNRRGDERIGKAPILAHAFALGPLHGSAGFVHFAFPQACERIVPRLLGDTAFWVRWSGVAEIGCAALLAGPRTRRVGALATMGLLVVVFPANAKMALDGGIAEEPFPLGSPVVAWGRLPLQVPILVWAWKVAAAAGDRRPTAPPPHRPGTPPHTMSSRLSAGPGDLVTWRGTSRTVEATEEFSLRKLLISAVALSALGLATAATPSGADGFRRVGSFRASLAPVPHDPGADNGSNASGQASLVLSGDHLSAFVFARGLSPNLPHAMHIHGHEEAVAECPSLARAGEDGLIDTLEGLPDYGGIQVSFTTQGATEGNLLPDGLDLARAPVADRFGFVSYRRTFPIPNDVAERLADKHIVIHGHDLNGNGTYDGELSSLSAVVGAPVPLEAELPVACGPLNGFVRNLG